MPPSDAWFYIERTYDNATRRVDRDGEIVGSDGAPMHYINRLVEGGAWEWYNGGLDDVVIRRPPLSGIELRSIGACAQT